MLNASGKCFFFLHAAQILEKKNVDNQLAFWEKKSGQPTNSLAYIYIYIHIRERYYIRERYMRERER